MVVKLDEDELIEHWTLVGDELGRQLAIGLGRDEDDLPKPDHRFADPGLARQPPCCAGWR
jgi:hypothetical protein